MRASLRLLLTHRLLWSFIGVTALSCLVWMLGRSGHGASRVLWNLCSLASSP